MRSWKIALLGAYEIVEDWRVIVNKQKRLARRLPVTLATLFIISAIAALIGLLPSHKPASTKTNLDDRLLDLRGFIMTGNEENCIKRTKPKLLHIAVHSSRENYVRRDTIRRTWGSLRNYKDWQISVNFLLGSPPSPPRFRDNVITQIIQNESSSFGDMIVGTFVDTYRNLSYKHMMGFKWLLQSCPQVDVHIKTDDDVFVNVHKIVDWLSSSNKTTTTTAEGLLDEDSFYCYVLRGYSPLRSRKYKFYVSKDEYRPSKYPDFCSGMGYIARPGLVRKLYGISGRVKFLWVEDLFATGILPKYYNEQSTGGAQIRLEDMSQYYLNEQYEIYRRWIGDDSAVNNPWFFILLEKKDEHELVLEQWSLWKKTMANELEKNNLH